MHSSKIWVARARQRRGTASRHDNRRWPAILLLAALMPVVAASGCGELTGRDEDLSGRVSMWHSWSPEEEAVLHKAIDSFEDLHPDVSVTLMDYAPTDLLEAFEYAASSGTAPSLMLGSDAWVRELTDDGWAHPIGADVLGDQPLVGGAETASTYTDDLYGVPVSLAPNALYYNTALVETPPKNLPELLQQAEDGRDVAMVPRFQSSYWGIQGFGRGLFDDEGRFTLADSGFAEWLAWLDAAQVEPGVILHEDNATLRDLFTQGEVAYYVAGPEQQPALVAAMGVDGVGVSPLPDGPVGAAGPLLPVETVYVYAFAAPRQHRIAVALAKHLSNTQQSMRFMRELGRVPVNPDVRVDSRLYPTVAGFAEQAATGVVLPSDVVNERLYALGDRAYKSVLSGAASPEEAICAFGRDVVAMQGYEVDEVSLPEGCELDVEVDGNG